MGLKSGRVGVHPSQVTKTGKIKGTSIIPASILAKIERALLLPVATPTGKQIVGYDETKAQVAFSVGGDIIIDGATSPYTIKTNIPEHAAGDAGKVLTVDNDGSMIWDTPSGAGGLVVVDRGVVNFGTVNAESWAHQNIGGFKWVESTDYLFYTTVTATAFSAQGGICPLITTLNGSTFGDNETKWFGACVNNLGQVAALEVKLQWVHLRRTA